MGPQIVTHTPKLAALASSLICGSIRWILSYPGVAVAVFALLAKNQ